MFRNLSLISLLKNLSEVVIFVFILIQRDSHKVNIIIESKNLFICFVCLPGIEKKKELVKNHLKISIKKLN